MQDRNTELRPNVCAVYGETSGAWRGADVKTEQMRKCRIRHTPNALHAYTATLKGQGLYGWGDTAAEARECLRKRMQDRPAAKGEGEG